MSIDALLIGSQIALQLMDRAMAAAALAKQVHSEGRTFTMAELDALFALDDATRERGEKVKALVLAGQAVPVELLMPPGAAA
jgi:hypothetical protein